MRNVALWLVGVVGFSALTPADGQWRAGEPAVVTRQLAPAPVSPNRSAAFKQAYVAAGRPTIVLFWNKTFDDQTETARETVETRTRIDSDTQVRRTRTQPYDGAARTPDVSEPDAVELEMAFARSLRVAGVRFVDRAAIIRSTQATTDRTDVTDPKLIETDAVLDKAALLMEILLVPDDRAALGFGFRVSVKDISKGHELAALYTLAQPEAPPAPGHYQATDKGFVWTQSPPPAIGASDVGVTLADDVMAALESRLSRN